jgi:hypothetical protein
MSPASPMVALSGGGGGGGIWTGGGGKGHSVGGEVWGSKACDVLVSPHEVSAAQHEPCLSYSGVEWGKCNGEGNVGTTCEPGGGGHCSRVAARGVMCWAVPLEL